MKTLQRLVFTVAVLLAGSASAGGPTLSVGALRLETNTNPGCTLGDTCIWANGNVLKFRKTDGTDLVLTAPSIDASQITGTLPINHGGTNSATALNNNRVMQSSGGAIVESAAITANRALISDGSGIPTHSSVTATEQGYLSGVTGFIQTQLDSKAVDASVIHTTGDESAAGTKSFTGRIAANMIENLAGDTALQFVWRFDGSVSDEYASATTAQVVPPFTIETWFKYDSADVFDASTKPMVLSTNGSNVTGSIEIVIGAGGTVELYQASNQITVGAVAVHDGIWHHVAFVATGTGASAKTYQLYVDGALDGSGSVPVNMRIQHPTVSGPAAGIFLPMSSGSIDEMRASNVVRYSTPFTPATSFSLDVSTTFLYHFSDATGSTVTDASSNGYNATVSGSPFWGAGVTAQALPMLADFIGLSFHAGDLRVGSDHRIIANTIMGDPSAPHGWALNITDGVLGLASAYLTFDGDGNVQLHAGDGGGIGLQGMEYDTAKTGFWLGGGPGGPTGPVVFLEGGIANQVHLTCTVSETVGSVVYVSAANTVALADPTDITKGPALGIVASKPSDTDCEVQTSGPISGLTLTAGAVYYVGAGGTITATPGTSAGDWVQTIGIALSDTGTGGTLFVRPAANIEAVY